MLDDGYQDNSNKINFYQIFGFYTANVIIRGSAFQSKSNVRQTNVGQTLNAEDNGYYVCTSCISLRNLALISI